MYTYVCAVYTDLCCVYSVLIESPILIGVAESLGGHPTSSLDCNSLTRCQDFCGVANRIALFGECAVRLRDSAGCT